MSACAKAWVHAECGVFGNGYMWLSEAGGAILGGGGTGDEATEMGGWE